MPQYPIRKELPNFWNIQMLSVPIPNAPSNTKYPTGNTFTDPTNSSIIKQFENDDADAVIYSYDASTNAPAFFMPIQSLRSSNISVNDILISNPCLSNTGGSGTSLTTLYGNLSNAQIALNSSITLLNIWKDGGNANLDQQVETTQPWDAYRLMAAFWG